MMKIIFFGSTGNCGRYITKRLLASGHEVHGIGRTKQDLSNSQFHFYQGDIGNPALFEKLPTDADCVINFAGVQPSILPMSEKTNLETTLETYVKINVLGAFNVLEFTRKSKIQRYIYTTSHRDYEHYWSNHKRLKNDLPPAINYSGDHSMYAITKTSAKMIGDYYGEAFGIKVFNLRLPMIFIVPETPYYLSNGQKKIMPFLQIIKDALNGKTLEIWGDPKMVRDYVHVENLWFLLNSCLKSKISGGTFNVGTGEAVTTEEFVRSIQTIFDKKNQCQIIYRPEKVTYKNAVYDVEKEKTLFDYEPVKLIDMLQKIREELINRDLIKKWRW